MIERFSSKLKSFNLLKAKPMMRFFVVISVCFFANKVSAFSPIGRQVFSSDIKGQPFSAKTGVLYLSHYHEAYNQTFYTVEAKANKNISKKSKLVLDAFGLLKVSGEGTSSYSLRELYYINKVSPKLSYSVGRKIMNWSELEEFLPTGFWNNSWDYNKSAPLVEGNFGAFIDYKLSKKSKASFFASPISVPKLTSHYNFGDDGVVSANTLWITPPPTKIDYSGDEYAVKEFVEIDIPELILHPQIGGVYDWSSEKTFLKASYLYGPTKDFDLEIDFALNATTPETSVDVTITPNRVNTHKVGFEFGRNWSESSKTTMSVSYSQRVSKLKDDPSGLKSYIGTSSGGIYQIVHKESFKKGRVQLRVHAIENTSISNTSSGELDELLLSSHAQAFRYVRGAGLSVGYLLGKSTKLTAYGYYDVELDGALGDLKLNIDLGKASLVVGYNFVEALSSESKDFYKSFRENDSYHMGVSYVF